MSLLIHIYYTGQGGAARRFTHEMTAGGIAEKIRAKAGNVRYDYFFPAEDPETVLLIDEWTDQAALDLHHKSEMMQIIATLRQRLKLKLRVERYLSEK